MFKKENRELANSLLKYGILLCRGYAVSCPIRTRLMLIRMQMASLQDMNAKWQIKILNFWINRFLREHHDDLQTPEGLKPQRYKNGGVSKRYWYKHISDGSEGDSHS